MRAEPIVLTLQFDEATADALEALRRAHYPPAQNRVPAHLTLFHALPGEDPDAVLAAVAGHTRRPPFPVIVEAPVPLGRGVALRIASPTLLALRADLAARFRPFLTAPDRERFRPHVTVQNKVSRAQARRTLATLSARFAPFTATAEGLQLWRYRGGPWAPLAAVPFTPPDRRAPLAG